MVTGALNALQQPTRSQSRRRTTPRRKQISRRSETEIASGTPTLPPQQLPSRSTPTTRAPPSRLKPTADRKSSGFPRQKSPKLRRARGLSSQLPPRSSSDSDASAARMPPPHRKGPTPKPAPTIHSPSTSTLKRTSSTLHVISPRPLITKR